MVLMEDERDRGKEDEAEGSEVAGAKWGILVVQGLSWLCLCLCFPHCSKLT